MLIINNNRIQTAYDTKFYHERCFTETGIFIPDKKLLYRIQIRPVLEYCSLWAGGRERRVAGCRPGGPGSIPGASTELIFGSFVGREEIGGQPNILGT